MKRFLVAAALLLITAASSFADEKKTDFNGYWILNEDSSKVDEQTARFLPAEIAIIQDGNTLNISKKGNFTDDEELTLDGKETKSTVWNSERVSTASWSQDKKSLKIVTKILGGRGESTTEWIMSLKPNGDMLVAYKSSSPRGEREAQLLYANVAK